MSVVIEIGIVIWVVSFVMVMALCRVAARADRRLRYDDSDPYLVRERHQKVERAMARFTADHSDRERIGL